MFNKNFECKSLQWDTDYFGVKSARVNLNGIVDEKGQDEIMSFCKEYDFVTISNNKNITENNLWLGKETEAFLADLNIQFVKKLKDLQSYEDNQTYVINNLSKDDQITEIAKTSFGYSRFFNDSQLPELKAKNIYSYWTECAFNQEGKYFVVNKKDEQVTGYILFSINGEESTVELIAVGAKYQGQGVGKSLINTMEKFLIEKGIEKIKVGTQGENISAAQFYAKNGYIYMGCGSIYHLWRR